MVKSIPEERRSIPCDSAPLSHGRRARDPPYSNVCGGLLGYRNLPSFFILSNAEVHNPVRDLPAFRKGLEVCLPNVHDQ